MAKTLVMNFLTQQGKKASIKLKDIKDEIDSLGVVSLMDTIIEKDIFVTPSGGFKSKKSAQIVDTTVEDLNI